METYPTWIRLHPNAVDDTLATSVQARIQDPLWMLGRQWQFNELRHDAGATPIDIRVEGTTAPLARLRGGAASGTGASIAIKPLSTPLETLVEREAVQETGLDNLRLRIESGLHLVRMLRAAALETRVPFWIQQSPFAIPDLSLLDNESREWLELADGRVPDGGKLAAAVRAQLAPATTPPIEQAEATVLRAWLTWASTRFDVPGGGPSTWDPTHMEYSFSAAGRGATEEVLLAAPEYLEGRLDWYAFEQAAGSLGVTGQATPRRSFRVPAPLDFAGMPNPRFWTFEDPSVRFDLLDALSQPGANPSPATLMVLDFALSYSDDWFLVPMALDVWTLFEATSVAVTDVFGDVTIANPPAGRWNMFRLDAAANPADLTAANPANLSRQYVVAGPALSTEGPVLEELHFLPDEVANVAWAVERVVPQALGRGRLLSEPPASAPATMPSGLAWTLLPPAPPGNWFPLMPATIGRLALGVLWSARTQLPSGRLLTELRNLRQPLHQEEVPAEGAQVSRRWQSARGIDGSLHFWVGRSKTPRRTDIAPAVRFDVVEYK